MTQLRNGQTFWDSSAPQTTSTIPLPDPLQIKPNGVQPHQAGVYEDFSKFGLDVMKCSSYSNIGMDPRRRIASRPSSTVSYSRTDMMTPGIYASSPAPDSGVNQTAFNHQDAMDRFTVRYLPNDQNFIDDDIR